MNAVERIVHYAVLDSEGERQKAQDPPASWPAEGAIKFDNAELAYREGLPLVLKGVSFDIKPREKVYPHPILKVASTHTFLGRHCG
jgi:ATP-binding cassette, subfamily C (CFTR/MRP), member 1